MEDNEIKQGTIIILQAALLITTLAVMAELAISIWY